MQLTAAAAAAAERRLTCHSCTCGCGIHRFSLCMWRGEGREGPARLTDEQHQVHGASGHHWAAVATSVQQTTTVVLLHVSMRREGAAGAPSCSDLLGPLMRHT
jgi:hypothetical protein